MDDKQVASVQAGVLRADPALVWEESPWVASYAWMAKQMRQRLGEPPAGVLLPVWAWNAHYGATKKPDLRGWAFSGYDDWLVELEIPKERVLVSDFQLWHFVLNGWYLPFTDEEGQMAMEDYPKKQPWELKFEERFAQLKEETGDKIKACYLAWEEVYGPSWEQIFDRGYSVRDYADDPPALQATAWEFRAEDIVKVIKINRNSRPNDRAVRQKRDEGNARFRAGYERDEWEERWEEVFTW
jgi:hypothetical protein